MKFDTVIIGGGLAALTAGISLLKRGKRAAIVSAGQSALHFCSGSFELLGAVDGKPVDSPLDALSSLPPEHPYSRLGTERVKELLPRVAPLLREAGLHVSGSHERNSYRLTPFGLVKSAWLTLDDHLMLESPDRFPFKSAAIINVYGYIDFYPTMLAESMLRHGVTPTVTTYDSPAIAHLRRSSTEMRSSTMARVITPDELREIAGQFNSKAADCDVILTPAIFGLYSDEDVQELRRQVTKPVYFIPTVPANVPGVRTQLQLREHFQRLGGTYFLGDTAVRGEFEDNRLRRLFTENLGDMPLEADSFILASGSFFSEGIKADMERVREPVFDLDLNIRGGRTEWYDKDFFADQPYMKFGVLTDGQFRPSIQGRTVENLYACGSILGGCNALKEQCGAGVTVLTALHVADLT